jgi:hypothetical protein
LKHILASGYCEIYGEMCASLPWLQSLYKKFVAEGKLKSPPSSPVKTNPKQVLSPRSASNQQQQQSNKSLDKVSPNALYQSIGTVLSEENLSTVSVEADALTKVFTPGQAISTKFIEKYAADFKIETERLRDLSNR